MDFQKLDIEIDKLFENSGIPALSVIITDKDQNIYEKYLGFQNIENKTSFSKSSIALLSRKNSGLEQTSKSASGQI